MCLVRTDTESQFPFLLGNKYSYMTNSYPHKANCPGGEYESKTGKFEYIMMQKGFAAVEKRMIGSTRLGSFMWC